MAVLAASPRLLSPQKWAYRDIAHTNDADRQRAAVFVDWQTSSEFVSRKMPVIEAGFHLFDIVKLQPTTNDLVKPKTATRGKLKQRKVEKVDISPAAAFVSNAFRRKLMGLAAKKPDAVASAQALPKKTRTRDIAAITAAERDAESLDPLLFAWSDEEFAASQAVRAFCSETYADH